MGMLYSPAAGILLTITNQILMKDVNRYKFEADTKSAKPIVNPDYTLTRPKRLNKFEKVNGMKVVKAGRIEPEKIKRPKLAGRIRFGRGKEEKYLKYSAKSNVETVKEMGAAQND